MDILHKVVLYTVLSFVVIGGAITLAGTESGQGASTEAKVAPELVATDGQEGAKNGS